MVRIIGSINLHVHHQIRQNKIKMEGFYSAMRGNNPVTSNPHSLDSTNGMSFNAGYFMANKLQTKFGKL